MSEQTIIQQILAKLKGRQVLIYLKNSFRHKGVLLDFDERFIILRDERKGQTVISLDSLEKIEEAQPEPIFKFGGGKK